MKIRDQFIFVKEGLRLAGRMVERLGRFAHTHHQGSSEEICRAVVKDCWNGRYFRAGLDHLDQFWIRDFGICLEGLIDLGFADQARDCLRWALERYDRYGAITTTIFLDKDPIDIYHYSSDSLPFLLYSLQKLGMTKELQDYRVLLTIAVERYRRELFAEDGTVDHQRMFSATKDTTIFQGTCYTHAMAAWCTELLRSIEALPNFQGLTDLRALLMERFWRDDHFRNDMHSEPAILSADANFWPFWCQIADFEECLAKSVKSVRAEGLASPFPLKYHSQRYPSKEVWIQRLFLPNYQGDSIWSFFSSQWLELASLVDAKAAWKDIERYEQLLQTYGTWVEVYDPAGEAPLKGRFGWSSDWGMLWAAAFPKARKTVSQRLED